MATTHYKGTMMDKEIYALVVGELGKSRTTASAWASNNSYPAEVCLEIEQLTDGRITSNRLRPDLFKPNPAQIILSNVVKDIDNVDDKTTYLLTGVLSYFESQQPIIFDELIESLKGSDFGKSYLTQRMIYTNEKL